MNLLCHAILFALCWCLGIGIELDPLPELELDPAIYPKTRPPNWTFADVKLGDDILEWRHYSYELVQFPALESARQEMMRNSEILRILGDDNEGYECLLPIPTPSKQPETIKEAATIEDKEEETALKLERTLHRLESLKKNCLHKYAGYWSYELCHMKHVRQYHQETARASVINFVVPQGAQALLGTQLGELLESAIGQVEQSTVTEEYLLGRYVPDQADNRLTDGRLVQQYIDGDRCPEMQQATGNAASNATEGLARHTEVRFECSMAKPIEHIREITEVSTCKYILKVGSPRLCSPAAGLLGSERSVKCFPIPSSSTDPSKIHVASAAAKSDHQESIFSEAQKKGWEKLFWRRKLRDFLQRDHLNFPMIDKLLRDFMQEEHLTVQVDSENGHEIPEQLLRKWLSILGIQLPEGEIYLSQRTTTTTDTRRAATETGAKPAQPSPPPSQSNGAAAENEPQNEEADGDADRDRKASQKGSFRPNMDHVFAQFGL